MKRTLAFVFALVLAFACVASAVAEDSFKIGMIGPLTGPYAIYGEAAVNGAKIAAEEINALGGIQFEIIAKDDEGSGEKGINAYNIILDNGAVCILGTVTSGSCDAVATVANEDRVFMLTPTASGDYVIEDRDNVFQVCFKDSNQGEASAQYIFDNALGTKVGIIYNNSLDYSLGIRKTFKAKADELGLEIVAESSFSDDQNADFSAQITAMKEAGADIVFLPIYYTPAAMILTQSNQVGYDPIFFGVDGMDGILAMEGFDKTLAEGVMLLVPFSADSADENVQSFVSKYVALYGETPNQFAADGYDGMYALYEAFNRSGLEYGTAAEEACDILIETFQADDFEITGVTGIMSWDETGAVTKTPLAVVIKDGVYVLYTK